MGSSSPRHSAQGRPLKLKLLQHIPHPWAFRASPSPSRSLSPTTAPSSACQPEPQMDLETPGCHHPWYNLLCPTEHPCDPHLLLQRLLSPASPAPSTRAPPPVPITPASQGPGQTFTKPSLATPAHTSFSEALLPFRASMLLVLRLDQGFQHLGCIPSTVITNASSHHPESSQRCHLGCEASAGQAA